MCTHGASAGKTQDVRPQSESQITFPRGEERGRKNGAAAGVAMVVVVVVAFSSLLCLGGLETGNSPRHRLSRELHQLNLIFVCAFDSDLS